MEPLLCVLASEFAAYAIQDYGLLAVFMLILLKYACFPLHSEVVLPLSGAVAAQNGWSLSAILLLGLVAGTPGSLICYIVGRFGGCRMLEAVKWEFLRIKKA